MDSSHCFMGYGLIIFNSKKCLYFCMRWLLSERFYFLFLERKIFIFMKLGWSIWNMERMINLDADIHSGFFYETLILNLTESMFIYQLIRYKINKKDTCVRTPECPPLSIRSLSARKKKQNFFHKKLNSIKINFHQTKPNLHQSSCCHSMPFEFNE